jgi:hypothetical protein
MLIFRDAERGDRVSLAHVSDLEAATVQASDPKARKVKAETAWTVTDLTDFPVGAWEPSFDTDLWREHNRLHLYVQTVGQGDGERLTNTLPQEVYILEAE